MCIWLIISIIVDATTRWAINSQLIIVTPPPLPPAGNHLYCHFIDTHVSSLYVANSSIRPVSLFIWLKSPLKATHNNTYLKSHCSQCLRPAFNTSTIHFQPNAHPLHSIRCIAMVSRRPRDEFTQTIPIRHTHNLECRKTCILCMCFYAHTYGGVYEKQIANLFLLSFWSKHQHIIHESVQFTFTDHHHLHQLHHSTTMRSQIGFNLVQIGFTLQTVYLYIFAHVLLSGMTDFFKVLILLISMHLHWSRFMACSHFYIIFTEQVIAFGQSTNIKFWLESALNRPS